MDRAASAVSAGAAALACRSSVDARVVQPGEACVGMEVDVKFDQGEVYRGKILLMAKKAHGEEEKAEVVIEFGDYKPSYSNRPTRCTCATIALRMLAFHRISVPPTEAAWSLPRLRSTNIR